MNYSAITGLLIALAVPQASPAPKATGLPPSTASDSPAVAEAWRTSWVEFVKALDDFHKQAKPDELPAMGLLGTARGQTVPDTWAVMKRFNGAVVFEGTFRGMATEGLMEGMTAKVDIRMPTPNEPDEHVILVHVYPTTASIPTWQGMAPGTAVKFRAQVTGVALIPEFVAASFPKGSVGYVILLQEAEPAT